MNPLDKLITAVLVLHTLHTYPFLHLVLSASLIGCALISKSWLHFCILAALILFSFSINQRYFRKAPIALIIQLFLVTTLGVCAILASSWNQFLVIANVVVGGLGIWVWVYEEEPMEVLLEVGIWAMGMVHCFIGVFVVRGAVHELVGGYTNAPVISMWEYA